MKSTGSTIAVEQLQSLAHDSALDTAARHAAGHLALLVHGHGRTGIARTRPLDVDHPGHGDAVARRPPPLDVVEYLLHGTSFLVIPT